jgi:hypothetical protein
MQKTYILPNVPGGFDSFVQTVVGDSRDGSVSPPPLQEEVPVDDAIVETESSSSTTSEFFSPISTIVPMPAVSIPTEDEPPLTEEERLVTAPVQGLLDKMNQASSRMIECEQELHNLESNRRRVASEWHDKKSILIRDIGSYVIERARPIFEAYEHQLQLQAAVNDATLLYNQAVIECEEMKQALNTASENGSTDNHLSDLLAMLVSVQTKRDTFEHLSLDRTNEFKVAQENVFELRKNVGLRTVQKAWPWYEAFLESKGQSEELTDRIHRLKKELDLLREEYRDSMHALEAISAKVHAIRKKNQEDISELDHNAS